MSTTIPFGVVDTIALYVRLNCAQRRQHCKPCIFQKTNLFLSYRKLFFTESIDVTATVAALSTIETATNDSCIIDALHMSSNALRYLATRTKFVDAQHKAAHSMHHAMQPGVKVIHEALILALARCTMNVKSKRRKHCHVFVFSGISNLGYSIGISICTARKQQDSRTNTTRQGNTVEGRHSIKGSNVGLRAKETNTETPV